MRAAFAAAVVAFVAVAPPAPPARADMSLPVTTAEPKWIARCSARLDEARAAAAATVPLFAAAHVAGADLYLDESLLGSATPALFEAYVVERHTQWSDPGVTARRWTTVARDADALSIYRQSPTLEGAIVSYRMSRYLTRAQVERVVDDIFKPAVDACLTLANAAE